VSERLIAAIDLTTIEIVKDGFIDESLNCLGKEMRPEARS
jgi:hypothetical protein